MIIIKRKNLSYFLFRLIIFLSYFIFNQTYAANVVNYSLLLGENSSTVMYIFRFDDNSKGAFLVEYGGSNSFKNAHTLGQNYGNSYIMPPKYGDNNKQETWTRLEYKLKNFQYNYEVRGNDQILGLASKESMQLIERYISNYESFSFSSKNNNNFYKTILVPAKTIFDLKIFYKNNKRVYCKIINETEIVKHINKELNKNLVTISKDNGLLCNNKFKVEKPKEKTKEKNQTNNDQKKPDKENTKNNTSKNKKLSKNDNYLNEYWLHFVVLFVVIFFIFKINRSTKKEKLKTSLSKKKNVEKKVAKLKKTKIRTDKNLENKEFINEKLKIKIKEEKKIVNKEKKDKNVIKKQVDKQIDENLDDLDFDV